MGASFVISNDLCRDGRARLFSARPRSERWAAAGVIFRYQAIFRVNVVAVLEHDVTSASFSSLF